MGKYTKAQLKQWAIEAIESRNAGDVLYLMRLNLLATAVGEPSRLVEMRIESLAGLR